ncbi:hypothetical protein [Pseudomonas sp. UMAB-08]|uniref:hypothetical protein n=1 Tax=Pseudomonas sp. UMAB-08 TaxID=1365375 RepID=UPI001C58D56F|nr:hypothetical protein [Pseudomonas sp. UMAB-08]
MSSNARSFDADSSHTTTRLAAERYRLNTTIGRVGKLNATKLKPPDVYGNAAQSPAFEASLKRWRAHKENNVKVQLAMIPSRPDNTDIAGVYQDVDRDPMV